MSALLAGIRNLFTTPGASLAVRAAPQKRERQKNLRYSDILPLSGPQKAQEGPFPVLLVRLTACTLQASCSASGGSILPHQTQASRKPLRWRACTACKRADECLPCAAFLSLPSYTHHQHTRISIHTPPRVTVGSWRAFPWLPPTVHRLHPLPPSS